MERPKRVRKKRAYFTSPAFCRCLSTYIHRTCTTCTGNVSEAMACHSTLFLFPRWLQCAAHVTRICGMSFTCVPAHHLPRPLSVVSWPTNSHDVIDAINSVQPLQRTAFPFWDRDGRPQAWQAPEKTTHPEHPPRTVTAVCFLTNADIEKE